MGPFGGVSPLELGAYRRARSPRDVRFVALSLCADDETPTVSGIALTVHGATDIGRKRPRNEDAFVVVPLDHGAAPSDVAGPFDVNECPVLLAVADGVGSQDAGDVASKLTLDALRNSLLVEVERRFPADALRTSVGCAHRKVRNAGSEHPKGMGSTLVAAVIASNAAYVAGIGDSRLYLYRDGDLIQVTRDDTLYQHAIDHGATLVDEEAAHHMLLQVIGQPGELSMEVQRVPLQSGDLLLLCSDGLSGMITDDELAWELERASSLDVLAQDLITLANAAGGTDNVTVVVARLA